MDDTIAAISTSIGQGGIGIVRLSGPEALDIAARLFIPSVARHRPWRERAQSNRLYYGHVLDPETDGLVDEVLVSYMRAPHTYTRQDVVEINAHGGIMALRAILSLCLASGARLAHEGEFTLRAFVNGRIDLAQAEAVLDVVNAKTEASLRVAVGQLGGRLSGQVRELRRRMVDLLAYLQATVDFPEEDIPPQEVAPELAELTQRLDDLLETADRGIIYRQGVRTAIVGRPNVGKSSLLNALLRVDRAIVTPIPGTTRDTLEEMFDLQGIPFVLVDTAGINRTQDLVERLGIERSRQAVVQADLVVVVVDGSVPPTEEDAQVADLACGRPALLAINKSDLPRVAGHEGLLPQAPQVAVSALYGDGIPTLERALTEMVFGGRIVLSDEPLVSSPRHRELLRQARAHIQDAQTALRQGLPLDLLSIDLSEAIQSLGEITGESASEDLLESIFGRFCIGK
ncbi:MAG: tRNA uridine-5-carboxymethylaminomethyl(34) synthesis GTPase MnmE [Anaerolineae bacterium]|nr:tRNA uridine-5-carboxymethylaminomethyl(34) synthesis GTPase MnmE [Anaerolineae bacterium]